MKILAVTCMRNEGPYCLEWIAHHRATGFTDFLIYTHDCTDGTDEILDLLPFVTHVPFEPAEGKSPQWRAMQLADKHPLMKTTDWAMFFDCDEFLCLAAPLSCVRDLIVSTPDNTDAIAVQWRLFGSSGLINWNEGLTLERFTMAAPIDLALPAGHFFKSLFRPSKFQKLGVHRPKNKGREIMNWMLGGTQSASLAFAGDDKRINLFGLVQAPVNARLNHYSTRSVTEFMIKRERGLPNRKTKSIDLSYWAERNFNTGKDSSIQSMLPPTKSALSDLQNLPDVDEKVKKAIELHHATFDTAMTDPSAVMLFLHLSLLTGSAAPTKQAINHHLARLLAAKSN